MIIIFKLLLLFYNNFFLTIVCASSKINFKIFNIKDHFPLIVKSSLIFMATSLPFILNLYFHENDVSKGAGLISLNIEKNFNFKIFYIKFYKN